MKNTFLVFCLLITHYTNSNADTISLFNCFNSVMKNFPLLKDKQNLIASSSIKIKNLNARWLPTIDLNGQATYQSDVVEFNLNLPFPGVTFPSVPHDQVKASLDINQTIYDGGTINKTKKLEEKMLEADLQQIEVEMNIIKNQIIKLYYAILILQKNEDQLKLILNELLEKEKNIQSAIENGISLPINKDILTVEIIKIKQKLEELKADRESIISSLATYTGITISAETTFLLPDINFNIPTENKRPEYQLFQLQQDKLLSAEKILISKRIPKIYAFSQLGYGKPGLNFLNDKFDSYYILGAGLKWNLWDWNTTNREKQLLKIQQNMILTKKETFDKQNEVQLNTLSASIKKYTTAINYYTDIVAIRKNISRNTSSQLNNGTITATEYIIELNAENQAKIALETYKILLNQAQAEYLHLTGNLFN